MELTASPGCPASQMARETARTAFAARAAEREHRRRSTVQYSTVHKESALELERRRPLEVEPDPRLLLRPGFS